jgi:hypothetical protein
MKQNSDIFYRFKQLIPLIILTIVALFTLINGLLYISDDNTFLLNTKHYLGFTTLIINYLVYIFLRKYFKIIITLTLLLGLFNFINFTAALITSSINIGNVLLGCQPYVFLICLLTYFLNKNSVHKMLHKVLEPSPEIVRVRKEKQEANSKRNFLLKYQTCSTTQLETILKEKRHVGEALEAAKQMVEQRKNI